jgi:diaminopropionate ammonia-lyase
MDDGASFVPNPARRETPPPHDAPAPARGFHATLPGYAATPLISVPTVAQRLGIRSLRVKDESLRLGLPSFKLLGVSWAVALAVLRQARSSDEPTLATVRAAAARLPGLALVAATDGNHGQAVARMASLIGVQARVYVPSGTAPARIDAIAGEGARVEVVDGTYDEAVERSGSELRPGDLLVTAAQSRVDPDIPRWMIEGYGTMLAELGEQARAAPPSIVAVQAGVGALAAAVARGVRGATLVLVEPRDASCYLASARAGRPVSVPGPHTSIMVGLNCGTPSPAAWPTVSAAVDAFMAVDDAAAVEAMRLLAAAGIVAGETGAAGLAGLLALSPEARSRLGLSAATDALVINTEGATAPDRYTAIVGRRAVT